MPTTAQLLTASAVAREAKVSVRTVIRRIESGELPATKLPGKSGYWLIKTADAQAYVETRRAELMASLPAKTGTAA